MEAFSSQGDGTLTIIKENSPNNFEVEQTLNTKPRAKTCTLDTKNNQIILIALEPAPTPNSSASTGTAASGEQAPGGKKAGKRGGGGGPGNLDILVVGH